MSDPRLSLENVTVDLGRTRIVHGLDLPALEPGRITALIGPNGAGKSTLLRALARLSPAGGRLMLGARDLFAAHPRAVSELVGYMPQASQHGVALSVLDAAVTALHAGPRPQDDAHPVDRALACLDRLGLGHLALTRLDRLSGGQRQMASLAQALVRAPRILLLDEPTSALDPGRQVEVMQAVADLVGERGMIAVVVMHDLELSLRWADRIVLMRNGRKLADGAPGDVVTAGTLSRAYGIDARVERCSRGYMHVHVDGMAEGRHG